MASGTEPLAWSDTYVSGIPEIDRQHKILVDLLNVVCESQTSDLSLELRERIIVDLINCSMHHFETEERHMLRFGYDEPEIEEATRHLEHQQLFQMLTATVNAAPKYGERAPLDKLARFLRDWLENHLLNTDFRLRAFLRDQHGQAGASP